MADNTTLNPGAGGDVIASDEIAGVKYQRVKMTLGNDNTNDGDVSTSNPMPISAASLPLPTGAGTAANQATIITALSNLLAELQLKADQTETQPISAASLPLPTGAGTAANQATIITALSNLLTELQLKADLTETQPISAVSLPLPTGAGTAANQATIITALSNLLTELQLKADQTETQPISAASLPLPTGAGTAANQATIITALSNLLTELQLKADLTETQPVNNISAVTGGATQYSLVCAASNNATSLKSTAGKIYSVQCFNKGTAPVYLKFYNKATSPNPASDTVVKSIMIPGDASGAGVSISMPVGCDFATGIAFAVVTGIGNTDNTGVNASEVIINIDYK